MKKPNESIEEAQKILEQIPLESLPVFFQQLTFKPNIMPKGLRPITHVEVSDYQTSKHIMSYGYKNISKSVNLK